MDKKHGYLWGHANDTKFSKFLEKVEDVVQWIANKTVNLYFDNKSRKCKIKIHEYDTWGMDNTLSVIILPLLKQLAATKHGSPWVNDEDVPENLGIRSTDSPVDDEGGGWDSNVHKRWDWVMNELIWTFEHLVADDSWDITEEEENRIKNGLILFGKYYQGLWD